VIRSLAREHVKDTDHDGVGHRHEGPGAAKVNVLAK
jgi:hypothetical protein